MKPYTIKVIPAGSGPFVVLPEFTKEVFHSASELVHAVQTQKGRVYSFDDPMAEQVGFIIQKNGRYLATHYVIGISDLVRSTRKLEQGHPLRDHFKTSRSRGELAQVLSTYVNGSGCC